jgi:hypothetical protein
VHDWFVQLKQQRGVLMAAVEALQAVPAAGAIRLINLPHSARCTISWMMAVGISA